MPVKKKANPARDEPPRATGTALVLYRPPVPTVRPAAPTYQGRTEGAGPDNPLDQWRLEALDDLDEFYPDTRLDPTTLFFRNRSRKR
jgi:hypothetical protein